ncbi:unnamed protein product [Prorocentrum cordatum]|uniref:RanBP2-type domain-containing protein n=1 Tax=Prorocentrum cordatum TaxID=2364126 RepID=A0ABN9UN40_9DINO|nr:unnamed protein product [Polarella glacialis]
MAGGAGSGGKHRFSRAPWHRSWGSSPQQPPGGQREQWPPLTPGLQVAFRPAGDGARRDQSNKGHRWKSSLCGCGKNESRFYFCKHCGSLKSASKLVLSARQGHYLVAKEGGKEYEQLATLCEKLGDRAGARAHRVAAKALTEPKSVTESTQVQLNKAHQRAKGIERKLVQAVGKYNTLEQQLAAQRDVAVQLRAALAEAEEQHKQLVQKLHSSLPQEDPTELDSRVQQLKTGVSSLAKDLLSQAKAKVDAIKKAWSGVKAMADYALTLTDEGNAEGARRSLLLQPPAGILAAREDYVPLFEQVAVAVGASADHASYSALYTQVHEAAQAADGKYAARGRCPLDSKLHAAHQAEEEEQGGGKAGREGGSVAPLCPDCGREMAWSNFAEGPYLGGWHCRNEDKCGSNDELSAYRWFCEACPEDICAACVEEEQGVAQPEAWEREEQRIVLAKVREHQPRMPVVEKPQVRLQAQAARCPDCGGDMESGATSGGETTRMAGTAGTWTGAAGTRSAPPAGGSAERAPRTSVRCA